MLAQPSNEAAAPVERALSPVAAPWAPPKPTPAETMSAAAPIFAPRPQQSIAETMAASAQQQQQQQQQPKTIADMLLANAQQSSTPIKVDLTPKATSAHPAAAAATAHPAAAAMMAFPSASRE